MKLFDIFREKRTSPENPTVAVSAESFLAFFGVQSGNLPVVTIDTALQCPAFSAAVTFLSASLANLPIHIYQSESDGTPKRANGPMERLLNESPNPEWSSFGWRKYLWQQTFTGGRGLTLIERSGTNIVGLWPMDPAYTTVQLISGKKSYRYLAKDYTARDVIDVPFMLKRDQYSAYSPVVMGAKAITLSLAMNDYASGFFAGGGVPPLALVGPLPAGAEAMKRAMADVSRVIDAARKSERPIFPMPPGHDLKPVGFDPEKGQMTEARAFQIAEIARLFNLPPIFLQDLSHGTFSNTEQQDLAFTKHLVAQWAKAFEEEINLKLFPGSRRYAEHSLDGLMRGDFKTRMEGLAQAVQNGLITPNEGRALDNRPPLPNGNDLMIQGATVPLGSQATQPNPGGTTEGVANGQ